MKNKILFVLISICTILVTLLTCIDVCCFDHSFYEKEYEKLEVAKHIGVSSEDLMQVTDVILDYTQDRRADMNVTAVVKGVEREYYSDREKAHMIDVKNLYLNAMKVRNVALILDIVLLAVFLLKKNRMYFQLSQIYNRTSLIFLAFVSMIGIYAASDFYHFWTNFHHVFFTNDLWLLDPRVDLLINMVPEEFFFDLVMKIILFFLLSFGSSNIIAILYRKKMIKNRV